MRMNRSLGRREVAASARRALKEVKQIDCSPSSFRALVDFTVKIFKSILNKFQTGF